MDQQYNKPCYVSLAEFGSVWGIALFHRHEEFNAKETTQKEGPKDKDNITEKHLFKEDYVLSIRSWILKHDLILYALYWRFLSHLLYLFYFVYIFKFLIFEV